MHKLTELELYRLLVLDESFKYNKKEDEKNSNKKSYYDCIDSNFNLRLSQNRQKALKRLIRSENKNFKIEDIERYLSALKKENELIIDVLDLMFKSIDSMIEKQDVYNIKIKNLEKWKMGLNGLDEDILIINYMLQDLKINNTNNQMRVINKMGTFMEAQCKEVEDILKDGIGIQHIHYSMMYPAVYSWIIIMNNNCLYLESSSQEGIDNCTSNNIFRSIKSREILILLAKIYKNNENIELAKLEKLLVDNINCEKFKNNDVGIMIANSNDINKDVINFGKITNSDKKMKKTINKEKFIKDYAIEELNIGELDTKCNALIGERLMYLFVLKYLKRLKIENYSSCYSKEISKIFWYYIIDKNKYLYNTQHTKNMVGFDAFKSRMSNGERELDKYIEKDTYSKHIADFLQESGYVTNLEVMIAVKYENGNKSNETSIDVESYYNEKTSILEKIEDYMQEKLSLRLKNESKKVSVKGILEFKKRDGEKLFERIDYKPLITKERKKLGKRFGRKNKVGEVYKAFHEKTKNEVANGYNEFIKLHEKKSLNIVGIDVADKELYCPPEIFSDLYRQIDEYTFKNFENKKLYKTYHIGEDFNSIMTGMRRVFESVEFLNMKKGDRLGHCSVLGIDINEWCNRLDVVSKSRIDILDDYVFEWYLLKLRKINDIKRIFELEQKIEIVSEAIYGKAILPRELGQAWLMRSKTKIDNIPKWLYYQENYMKNQSRIGVHNVIPEISLMPILFEVDSSILELPSNQSVRIYNEYLYDKNIINNFFETNEVKVIDEIDNLIRIQNIMIDILYEKGIVVESNPTSNWRILGLNNSKYIPAVQWIQKNKNIRFTINIDDPALFYNSIIGEYYLVFSSLKNKFALSEQLSNEDILIRMEKIRKESINSLFLI